MKCPICTEVNLTMSERRGIEIDYCPQCRGVWLDRGELDKIIERSAAIAPTSDASQISSSQPSSLLPLPNAPLPTFASREVLPENHFAEQSGDERHKNERRDYNRDFDDDDYDNRRYDSHKKKKRGGFLGELFDFD